MNIKEAKDQIRNAMLAYFTKNEFGEYEIPVERQRPVFLMGPPGVGKTEIVSQAAQELGVALVSYSMTHHTRQSALGLPFISHKNYGGAEYEVSEYTMSEIIASVYETMERSGVKEGILFLDEINCVSETLAPAMLQFLQYKVFGRHRVPEGWIVVTAGNPPEYNRSVREFDIVTWDRMKRVDVEPDFEVWKEYAYKKNVHASVLTYLEIKKSDFYTVETTGEGKQFVTARGWDDLSEMIKLYEKNGIPVDEKLACQYLQNRKIAKDFAVYYSLYNKYKMDYQIDKILAGEMDAQVKQRALKAGFDERLSLLGLLLDSVNAEIRGVCRAEDAATGLMEVLKRVKTDLYSMSAMPEAVLERYIAEKKDQLSRGRMGGYLSEADQDANHRITEALQGMRDLVAERAQEVGPTGIFPLIRQSFESYVEDLKGRAGQAGEKLKHLFRFVEEVFGEGQEMLILVTELTVNCHSARFIGRYGCEAYFAHNKELLFYERQQELMARLERFDLSED